MNLPAVNPFDAVVFASTIIAVVMGFHAGLLRSLATIFGYLIAAPIALAAAPQMSPALAGQFKGLDAQTWLLFGGIFVVTGIAVSALLRYAVTEFVGPGVSLPDRLAGCLLGAVRIGLLAVLMVLIFDRIIPPDRQPSFLADSRLRPILSIAGQKGLKSLPPDVTALIDQLKRDRGI